MEKQRDKAAKRLQRKDKPAGESYVIEGIDGPDGPLPGPDGTLLDADSTTQDADSPAVDPDNPPREA